MVSFCKDPLFSVKKLQMKIKQKQKAETDPKDVGIAPDLDEKGYVTVERIGVFCNDCDSLLKKLLSIREMNPHETTVLVGLDDGQGLLKVCMTVQENKFE